MKSSFLALLLLSVAPLACGGQSEEPNDGAACIRGEARDCTCPGGISSHQVCRQDGEGYQACLCDPQGSGGMNSSGGAESTGGQAQSGGFGGMGGSDSLPRCSDLGEEESHASCECSPSSFLCLGASLQKCRVTGDGFDEEALCDAPFLCDEGGSTCLPDLQPPSVPSGVATGSVLARSVDLSWNASNDDVTDASELTYQIYWATESGGQELTGSPQASVTGETSITIDMLPAFQDLYFVVVVADEASNRSEPSSEVHAKTLFSYLYNIEIGIYAQKCATSGCHAGVTPASSLNLSPGLSYDATVGVDSISVTDSGIARVEPNYPNASSIVTRIERNDMGTMPAPSEPLSQDEIDLIRYWIDLGAPDN